jgi:hypothetical protein
LIFYNYVFLYSNITHSILQYLKARVIIKNQVEKVAGGWFKELVQKGKQFGVEVNEKLYGERYETLSAKLGYKDACSLIDLYTSGKLIVSDGMPIAECLLQALISPPVDTTNKCVVMMMTGIRYDNPLLNHPNPNFLKQISDTCGTDMINLLIDLCNPLDLANEASGANEEYRIITEEIGLTSTGISQHFE